MVPMRADADPLTTENLLAAILPDLPLPARGATAIRWDHLAAVGRRDLALAKLVEPHHDATAILSELGAPVPGPGEVWAVWAAEPPGAGLSGAGLTATRDGDGWWLDGDKPFCSGATLVTHALVTAASNEGSRLLAVDVAAARDRGGTMAVHDGNWTGHGMARADTRAVTFTRADAAPIAGPGAYTDRPGFWWGAVGVAACWAGGVRGVAARLLATARRRSPDDLLAAHLGAVAVAVDRTRSALTIAAQEADSGAADSGAAGVAAARRTAESARAVVADAAEEVVSRVGRALGPGPLAFDAEHSQRVADLQFFVRQHHAERDLAALGTLLAAGPETW